MGYDGDIGTFTLDLDDGRAQASDGHKILSYKDITIEIESLRYPFCFPADPNNPLNDREANSTRSVVDLFPFNSDLNRLMLIVRGAKAKKLKITWGDKSKEFEAAAMERGINLASEFLDNPFCDPFAKTMSALQERDNCREWLKQEIYKNDASIPKRLEVALAALVPVPIKHTIKVEELP